MADKRKEKALGKHEILPAVAPDDQYVLVRAESSIGTGINKACNGA